VAVVATPASKLAKQLKRQMFALQQCRHVLHAIDAAQLNSEWPRSATNLRMQTALRLSSEACASVEAMKAEVDRAFEEVNPPPGVLAAPPSDPPQEEAPLYWRMAEQGASMAISAGTAVGTQIATIASRPLAATAEAAGRGVQTSIVSTYQACKPHVISTVKYLVTPYGLLNTGSTACAFASVQLAALAAASAAGAVGADAAAGALQTSAEVARATGNTGAVRRALRDPAYAERLQRALTARRAMQAQGRAHKLASRAVTWAKMVNTGVVARVSPMASNLVSNTGYRLYRMLGKGSAPEILDEAERRDAALADQRSYLVESTRLALVVNAWVSTDLLAKADGLRASPDESVAKLVALAATTSGYVQQGWYDGSLAVYSDIVGPALMTSASMGISFGWQAAGSALHVATHPFSTAWNVAKFAGNVAFGGSTTPVDLASETSSVSSAPTPENAARAG